MKYFSTLTGFLLILLIVVTAFTPQPDPITIYLIGDSTMSDKKVMAYPETGWGMPFKYYFDETVTVENHAHNGASTRTFIEEGRWQPVVQNLEKGDYVFIQFGHNDEVKTKEQYTSPKKFKENLTKFIIETRQKEAQPILLTPIARRHFDAEGHLIDTHKKYSELVREVAHKYDVPLIDMDKRSQKLLRKLGPEDSKFLYNYLKPGQNPHYPEGRSDDTHFNEYGARRMAELVLDGIIDLNLELAKRIAFNDK